MSSLDAGSVSAATPAERLSEPDWVRNGSPQVQQEYAVGLEFERMLVQQLAGSLTASSGSSGEASEGEGADAAGSVLSSMIPNALAEGVVAGGGLGLAADLTRQLQEGAGAAAGLPADVAPNGKAAPSGPGGGTEADVTGGARA
jgi:hypothetical protein